MNPLKLIALAPLVATSVHATSYDALLKRYERQITQQERRLKSLRGSLSEKQKDAEQWQRKAEESQTQWNAASEAVADARVKADAYRKNLNKTHALAETAGWVFAEKTAVAENAGGQLGYYTAEIYKEHMLANRYQPLTNEINVAVLTDLTALTGDVRLQAATARKEEDQLRLEEGRWQERNEQQAALLEQQQERQQTLWSKWQEARRRVAALQEEKDQLEQSEQALRVMLDELRGNRDQTLAAKRDAEASRGALTIARGSLPWPVNGKVSQGFGRQYSKDLDRLVISNGIKIEAPAGRPVHVVQSGTVLFAKPFQQYGQLVIVQHHGGLASVYAGLGQTQVKEGQVLGPLETVGALGDAGSFYFELRHNEEPINPLVWLAPNNHSELSTRRKFQ